ncbi:hypothetical protein AAC387_Pa08g1799 [Persea americana]
MHSCRRNPLLVICILFIILTSTCPSLSVARPLGGGYGMKKETHMFQSLEKGGVPPPCRSGGTIAPGGNCPPPQEMNFAAHVPTTAQASASEEAYNQDKIDSGS